MPLLLGCARRHAWPLRGALCAVLLGSACAIGTQWALKLMIDAMTSPRGAVLPIDAALGLFLALVAAENALWRMGGWVGSRAVVGMGADLRLLLFDRLTAQSAHYFGSRHVGALSGRITGAGDALRALMSGLIWNMVPPTSDFVGSIVVISMVDWRFAAVILVAGTVSAVATAVLGQRGFQRHRALYAESARTSGEVVDVIGNITLLKVFGARRREHDRLAAFLANEARVHQKSWNWVETTRAMHDVLLWLAIGGVLIMAVHSWRIGSLSIGSVIVVNTLAFRILNGSREVALASLGIVQQFNAVRDAIHLLTMPADIVDTATAVPLAVRLGEIALRNVSFAFDAGRPIFDGLDLHVLSGQRVGIVGPSGAGKSTLLQLILRLAEPQSGQVLIDGQSVGSVTQQSLAENVAVVTQDVSLLHRSVADNIRYGKPDATDSEVIAAAKTAQCHGFIGGLPAGYDTLVGERGFALSGGQRQRIAIARAILKDAPIIVLDEATSALDSESEIAVQRALTELTKGKTVLAVAHRLSTLLEFDRVVVLEHGRIVEDGPPHLLARNNGPFARSWHLQRSGRTQAA